MNINMGSADRKIRAFVVALPAAKQRLRRGRMMTVDALAQGRERQEALRGCRCAAQKCADCLSASVSAPREPHSGAFNRGAAAALRR